MCLDLVSIHNAGSCPHSWILVLVSFWSSSSRIVVRISGIVILISPFSESVSSECLKSVFAAREERKKNLLWYVKG
jgi:uncharacterized membrane protein (DUF4010 family)